jgi:hypothetical protein
MFIKSLSIRANKFSKEIGVSQGLVSQIINGDRSITRDFVKKITRRYPELSENWLFTGEPPMLKGEEVVKKYQIDDEKINLENEPTIEDLERLRADVIDRYKPETPLTVKQDLALRQACYKVMVENAGAPWSALVVGGGVYLRFIEAYPQLQLPEGRGEGTESPAGPG